MYFLPRKIKGSLTTDTAVEKFQRIPVGTIEKMIFDPVALLIVDVPYRKALVT